MGHTSCETNPTNERCKVQSFPHPKKLMEVVEIPREFQVTFEDLDVNPKIVGFSPQIIH